MRFPLPPGGGQGAGVLATALVLLVSRPAMAAPIAPASPMVQGTSLTLQQAIDTALAHQPELRQTQAQTRAAGARADESRAALLPQVSASGSYRTGTGNPTIVGAASSNTWETSDSVSGSVDATQLLFDFGQTTGRWGAARASAAAQGYGQQEAVLTTILDVRTAFFSARAQKDLVSVAKEALANQEQHLVQTEAFVQVGRNAEIDLAQGRSDRASAQVALIRAENAYETAKAQLNRVMGVDRGTGYDVADDSLGPVDGEDRTTDELLAEAMKVSPRLAAQQKDVTARRYDLESAIGQYGPRLSAFGHGTDGEPLAAGESPTWNWNAGVSLSWTIFDGLGREAGVRAAKADLAGAEAARDSARAQIRLDLDKARLAVTAAKAALASAGDAVKFAQERGRLAEARYRTGAGSPIEFSDAQLALSQAEANQVQAEFDLATARAQLLEVLGRR